MHMEFVARPPGGLGPFEPAVSLGIGPGDLFVTLALVYSLVVLYLLTATEIELAQRRALWYALLSGVVPFLLTFAGIVLYTTISII